MGRLDFQVVQQPLQVLHKGSGTRSAGQVQRVSKTPMVEGDAAVPLREERHLLPPAQQVAARTVGENDSFPFAVALVVKFYSVDRCAAHVAPLSLFMISGEGCGQ